jgi:LEA14-like dessication related protein
MGKSPLPWILAGGALVLYATGKAAQKALSAKNLNLKVTGFDFKAKPPVVELTLINPYQGFLELENITGDIIFNNNAIGTMYFNKLTALPPNKTIAIRVPVRLNPIDAAGILVDLINKPSSEWKKYFTNGKFTIAGSLTAENVILPYNQTWDFK